MSTALEYVNKDKRERKSVVVDHELERIYKKHKVITADSILDDARRPNSPLHSYFEWDDAIAGEKFRKVQAYAMIIGSKFVVNLVENGDAKPRQVKGTAQVRRLVSAFRGEGFTMRTDALKKAESRTAIIESKRSQLRSWCDSTIDLDELAALRRAILAQL